MMTLEEARQRVKICNNNTIVEETKNGWRCGNCGIGLIEEKRNKCGYKHYFRPSEKQCLYCEEVKDIDDFYYNTRSIDLRKNRCKECACKESAKITNKLKQIGRQRNMWMPDNLWQIIEKVKGKQTTRDFIILAIRKEVEVRTRDLMLRQAVDNINSKKPTRV